MINDIKLISTDVFNLVSSLKICSRKKDICKAIQIHTEILKQNLLEKSLYIGNALVSMYAKSGAFGKAQDVFEELPVRNVVTWTALVSGYVQNGHAIEALKLFNYMQLEGISPNQLTYVCILKACGITGMIEMGREIQVKVVREGYVESNIVLGTSLVDMYAKCGAISQAEEVFDVLVVRNLVTWNVLIQGYIEHEHAIKVLQSYELMQYEGLSPDSITFICVLRACGDVRECNQGQKVHVKILNEGMYEKNILITTALVDMYGKCGIPTKAKEVFDGILLHNVVMWTALISAYAHMHGEEALSCYEQMHQEGFLPDSTCFACIMKACASVKALRKGAIIHIEILEEGWLGKDAFIGTSLVDMYASCGSLVKAQEVFNDLSVPNRASWTSLMTGYAHLEQGEETLKCFHQMQQEGISPDAITFVCILKKCGSSIWIVPEGQKMHASLAGQGLINNDILVATTLIDMYANSGMQSEAQEVFNELLNQNQASWLALIVGYARNGYNEEVISYFQDMQKAHIIPNVDIFLCVLKACGNLGALEKGQEVHVEVGRRSLDKIIFIGTTLIDMYGKCGTCVKAQEVFDQLLTRDVVTWNALISGYAQLGGDEIVFNLFNKMIEEGVEPNVVSFTILLTSCNHSGLLYRGHMWFEAMKTCYGIVPNMEHYSCMVDLFGRAGRFNEIIFLLRNMHLDGDILLWHTVLAACQKWGNTELGRLAFERAIRLDENDAAIYVLISNVCASTVVE